MLKTFGDIKQSRVIQIASAPPDSPEFASLVNAATRQLINRGNWWGTVQPLMGCVYGGCVTWPRTVAAVLAFNKCHSPTLPANRWYQFMHWQDEFSNWARGFSNLSRGGRTTVNDGTLPVFNPIPCGMDMTLRFFIDNPTDVGKTIRIYGVGNNGQALVGQRSDGTWQDGLVLTFAIPSVSSPTPIRRIDRIVKDVTKGRVRGYQVDSNGTLYDMCLYHPQETSPDYVRTRVPGCGGFGAVTALVKLAYVPVVYNDDLVLIENEDALRDMVMSIKLKEGEDIAGAKELEKQAFRELNYEMRTRFPDEQFIVNFRPFGNDTLQRQGVGMI